MTQSKEAAQNQHYVPKFILRQFLSDEKKEQVTVYDKHEDRVFTTSIKNIMAERRFNDFTNNDLDISFEPIASKVENVVLPAYREVLKSRKLAKTADQQTALAFLVAFQFLRTKAHRATGDTLEDDIRRRVEAMGHRMEDIEGWQPRTEDVSKREHVRSIVDSIDPFTRLIAHKDFFLAEAAPGEAFYLADAPVSLTNRRTFGPYGNIGLGVPGIELYMPLSADLLLCMWCPSIFGERAKAVQDAKMAAEQEALSYLMEGRITAAQMKDTLNNVRELYDRPDPVTKNFERGTPVPSDAENMKHYNSLQAMYAYRYVISKDGSFDIAQRHNKEFPKFRYGNRPRID